MMLTIKVFMDVFNATLKVKSIEIYKKGFIF